MSVYCTILFISLCCSACVSLCSCESLIFLNGFDRVAWLVLLFESVSDSNGFGLSVRVRISTQEALRENRSEQLSSDISPFQLLQVDHKATCSEIKAARDKLLRVHHPDKNYHPDDK